MNAQSVQNISGTPLLLVGDDCIQCGKYINTSIYDILQTLNDINFKLNTSDLTRLDIVSFKTKSINLQLHMINASTCLLTYQDLLDSMDSWLDEASTLLSSSSDSIDISAATSIYNTINEIHTDFSLGYDDYLQAVSLQYLVNIIDKFYDMQLSLDDIDTSVFSKLTSITDSLELSLKDIYHSLFEKFGELNGHMAETDEVVENFLRNQLRTRHLAISVRQRGH
jgi:hypothetical protein